MERMKKQDKDWIELTIVTSSQAVEIIISYIIQYRCARNSYRRLKGCEF